MSVGYLYFLLVVLPGLSFIFWVLTVLFFGVSFSVGWDNENIKNGKKEIDGEAGLIAFTFCMGIVFLVLACFTPGKKDIAQIYVANYVTTHQDIKELPEYLIKFIKKEDG